MPELLRKGTRKAVLRCFRVFESLGFHVTPADHYSPIPHTRDLHDDLFARQSDCIGLDWNSDVQTNYLTEVFPRYATEVEFHDNPGLSVVDAAILHSMIRHHKPAKIVEIGSGWSTRFAAHACEMNRAEGSNTTLIAIEPNPSQMLQEGFPGLTRLVERKVEELPLGEIIDCDLLFIDSSHAVRTGGDVNFEILELLPRLKPGALVHWHDILLPGEYWRDWVKTGHTFWSEQYLLHAFLKFNNEFEIIWGSRYMHLKDATAISGSFPFFDPVDHHITSFWIRRKVAMASDNKDQ
jgi:predicted O-methyltransferase YrrM